MLTARDDATAIETLQVPHIGLNKIYTNVVSGGNISDAHWTERGYDTVQALCQTRYSAR
jgi:hypothetical protein